MPNTGGTFIREVSSKRDLRAFIRLPWELRRDDPDWLPPLLMDEWAYFDPRRNRSFGHSDTICLLAIRDGRPVGRIMGIINHRYNRLREEADGRFSCLECRDDPEVFRLLTEAVEQWVRGKGLQRIVGPLGFSDKDPQGFQVSGFEHPPFMTSPNNPPFMPRLLEAAGYLPKRDLVNYLGSIPAELPPVYGKVLARLERDTDVRLIEFGRKAEIRPHILEVLELMNITFAEIYASVPLDEREKKELASRYMPLLDPAFVKLVTVSGQLAGFAIGMPDLGSGIRRANGRLFPVGFLHILAAARQSRKLLMLIGGIRKEWRGMGLDVMMGAAMIRSARERKMELMDSHLVLEDNRRMCAEYERLGLHVAKRFRIFQKDL